MALQSEVYIIANGSPSSLELSGPFFLLPFDILCVAEE